MSYPTASNAIKRLEEAGFLREITGGNYGCQYVCDRVSDELAEN
ncbi:hypothetical protein [Amycolatopsis orientalis]|nr:hypothetical protein [Amycolatopsis orientalis]